MNQIKAATESYDAMMRRLMLGMLAGWVTFCLIWFFMTKLTPNVTVYSVISVLLISLVFAACVGKAVASKNQVERWRVAIGLSGVVVLFGILLVLKHDLLTGNVGLEQLRTGAVLRVDTQQTTCTPPPQVGKGYIPLEPCVTAEAITEPSFSSAK